jgi:hypothetical protein
VAGSSFSAIDGAPRSKILTYDGQGFWVCHKLLSQGRFPYWPTDGPIQELQAAHPRDNAGRKKGGVLREECALLLFGLRTSAGESTNEYIGRMRPIYVEA